MASRKTPQEQVQATLRDAVERTVSVGQQLRQQLENRTPATQDDLEAVRSELRALAKRIDKLEKKQGPKKKS